MDYNREVRRATHDTMTNLVIVVGFELLLCTVAFVYFFSFYFITEKCEPIEYFCFVSYSYIDQPTTFNLYCLVVTMCLANGYTTLLGEEYLLKTTD